MTSKRSRLEAIKQTEIYEEFKPSLRKMLQNQKRQVVVELNRKGAKTNFRKTRNTT